MIFEALEASSEQLPASTEASTFEALDVSMVHEVASTAVSIRAALEASMLNLSALSITSLTIFEALEASRERIFPLAGTVIVTLAFWMLFTFWSRVASSLPLTARTTTRLIRLSSASMRMSDTLSEMMTFTARDASIPSKSGAGTVLVTILPLPLMVLPSRGVAMQAT